MSVMNSVTRYGCPVGRAAALTVAICMTLLSAVEAFPAEPALTPHREFAVEYCRLSDLNKLEEREKLSAAFIAEAEAYITEHPVGPEIVQAKLNKALAVGLYGPGDDALSDALLSEIRSAYPESELMPEVMYQQGVLLMYTFEAKNAEEARVILLQLVEQFPTSSRAPTALRLGAQMTWWDANDPEEAILLFKRLLKDYPGSDAEVEARVNLISLLAESGDAAATREHVEVLLERLANARELAPPDAWYWYLMSPVPEACRRIHDRERLVKVLSAAADAYPDTDCALQAWDELIDLAISKGDRESALEQINEFTERYRTVPEGATPRIWACAVASAYEGGYLSEDEYRLAVRRLFTTLAGDMDTFAAMGSAGAAQLAEALQRLGQQDLESVVLGAQAVLGGHPDRLSSRQCAEAVCGLVLSQVASAEAKDRQRVWDIGRLYLADRIDGFSDRAFETLDGFVETMESDPVLAEAIITDLAKRTRNLHDTLPKLERRLTALALQRRIEQAPSDVQKSFWRAQQLQSEGDLAGATALFRAIVDGPACPSNIKDALNRRIVALLLEQQTNLAALDKYLPALRRQGEGIDAEAWNLSCRALFRRVAVAKDDRATVWKNGLGALAAPTIVVRRRTFEDLDKLTEFLGRDGGDLASTIIVDLLLCAPHGDSMRRLQWRRIAMFTQAGDFDSARTAAAMDVVLAAASGRDIAPSLERFEEILRSGGAAESDVARTAGSLLCGSGRDAATQPATRFVDEPLRTAAQEALKLAAGSDSPRRIAYLNLLAGNMDKALLAGRDGLLGCTSARQAAEALGDIYVMLAVADGNLANANRFADWLGASSDETSDQTPTWADDKRLATLAGGNWQDKTAASSPDTGQPFADWSPENRAALARAFSGQLAGELAASAGSAMDRGNKALAASLRALSIRGTTAPDTVGAALDSMIESLRVQMGLPDVLRSLRDILPLVPALPHRRIMLVRMAGLAHEEQLFDDCLALLDEADSLDTGTGQKDFAVAMLRASAMLELDDYDGADELLAEAAGWDGADENKAQCLFVTACLRLKQGQTKDAREILQKLTDQYPRTSVATKASQLAARLK
jgi:tetratricopeptide (TPR) repeat protein